MGLYNDAVNALSPTHYWKLDDASGNFTDSGSGNVTLTKTGTITQNQAGGIDGSVFASFNTSAYAQGNIGTSVWTDRIFTICGWWKKGSTSSNTSDLFGTNRSSTAAVRIGMASGVVTGRIVNDAGSVVSAGLSYTPDSDWHFYALVGNNTTLRFYVDGQQWGATATISGNLTPNGNFTINDAFIGGANDGSFDEVAVFNSALTGTQIRNLYLQQSANYRNSMQAKIASYSPEYHWQCDAADSATPIWHTSGSATDNTSWSRTTTAPSGNITRVSSTLPTAMPNAFMYSIPYASRYRTNATVYTSTEATDLDFVVGVWFKQNTGSSNAASLTKILGTTGTVFDMTMYSSTHGTYPGKMFWTAAGTSASGTINVDDGNWHFLAIRKVTGNNAYKCFVDGVLDVTITTASSMTAGNWQVGDSTQGSGSATVHVDNFFIASSANVTEQNLLDIRQFAFPAATNGGYTAQVMTVTTSTFPDPAISVQKSGGYTAELMEATNALVVDPLVSTDLSYEFNASPLTVTNAEIVAPNISTDATIDIGAAAMEATNAEFPQPTLSTTNNVEMSVGALTASAESFDVAISTEANTTADPMTASADDVAPGIVLDDGYTAIPATANASFSLVDPVVTINKDNSYSALPMTASATSGDHKRLNLWVVYPDKDVTGSATAVANVIDSTILEVTRLSQPERNAGIKFTLPSFITPANVNNITKVALKLTSTNGTDGSTFVLSGLVNNFEESGAYNLVSGVNPQYQINVSFTSANQTIEIDDTYVSSTTPAAKTLKDTIVDWVNGVRPNNGFKLTNNGPGNTEYYFHSSEAGIIDYRPQLVIYGDFGPLEVTAQPAPMTASALMADPNIIAGQSKDVAGDPLLASADAVLPAISAGTGVTVALDPSAHLEAFANLIPDPTVTTEQGAIVFANAKTASALMVHPTVAASGQDATVDTAPGTANASLPMPGIRQDDGAVANTMVATNATFVNPAVAADNIELVFAEPMLMRFAFLPPEEAVDETQDPYYQEILKTTNLYDSAWYRLDEISGSTVLSKTKDINPANLQANASFVGMPVFGNVGPRLRKTITFTGSQYITIPNPFGATGSSATGFDWLGAAGTQVTEITLKTIQTKGTILYGTDANTLAGAGTPQFWMLDIYNGRLRFRSGSDFRGVHLVRPDGLVIGNKLINDGEFHHIVIQLGNQLNSKQLEIYVDGQLDIARFNAPAGLGAHPDFIAGDGRPTRLFAYDTISYVPGNLEETPYFAGEIMEYVFRPNVTLTEYQIQQLFYRALDIEVKSFPSVTATAEMPEPFVDAGKPKALILSFWATSDYRDTGAFAPPLDEEPEYTRLIAGGFAPETFDTWEYYVNRVSANPQLTFIGATPGTAGVHRDPVTDEVVLLDPRTIPNIDKFRVIQIQGYPLDSNDVNGVFAGYNEEKGYQHALKALETFVGQVREIVDTYGTSLLVTNPRLAVDLGIVDDVEYADPLFERRFGAGQSLQNSGLYDYRSAQVDPIANPDGIGTGGFIDPFSYFDTHRNNRLRIVATQTGLTDIPDAWTLEDAVTKIPYDPLSMEEYSYKYKDTRTTGLTIGQELVINNHQVSKNQFGGANGDAYNIIRATDPVICFPPGSVKTGTVIARMANTYWNEQAQIANPYANYASIIVVNPGDSLKGTTVGGKIFVNCTERIDATYSNFAPFQTTNANETNPIIPGIQTEAGTAYEKQWQYSTGRLLQAKNGSFEPVGTTGGSAGAVRRNLSKLADKRLAAFKTRDGSIYYREVLTSQLFTLFVDEKYPIVLQWAPSMMERGIIWLLDREAISPNDAVIRPTTFIGTIIAPNSGLYINQDRTVSVSAMLATSRIVEPGESTPVDANSTALPMFAQARITGFARFINATPMTVSARFNTDLVTFAGGEQVVVTLPEIIRIELFMKEDSY